MKRKSLLILMALIICMSSFMGFTTSAFSDVAEGDKHSYAINYLTEKGVIHGYEDGTYKPNKDISRAEFLTLLLESINISNFYGEMAVKTGFADVDIGEHSVNDAGNQYTINNQAQHWAAGYIKIAVDKKIVSGYGNGLFKPDAPVTYEEAIKMVVCALGREGMAQTKVDTLGMPFWPDAYLSVGNDLLIARETDYAANTPATRGNIAQMLYNVKDVPVIFTPAVNTSGNSTSGGPVNIVTPSGSGSGQGSIEVKEKVVQGTVVATYKKISDKLYEKLMLDDSIVIGGEPKTDFNENYIAVKYDGEYVNKMFGETYGLFHVNGIDRSDKLAHHVEVRYLDDPNAGNSGKKTIISITSLETEVITIPSYYIKTEKTEEKNEESPDEKFICYTDGNEDFNQSLYTDDLDTLNVIYNNKLIDVEALGDGEGIDIITINDFMPVEGNISIVNVGDNNSIELIWVNSYETFVVGSSSFTNTRKEIYDKFKKDEQENPKELVLYDADSPVTLTIKNYNGEPLKEEDINGVNVILSVATSKCGTNISITKEKTARELPATGTGVEADFVTANSKKYQLTEYYKKYVAPTLKYEEDDDLVFYLDKNENAVWASVKEPNYSTAYIIAAIPPEGPEDDIELKLLSESGQPKSMFINDKTLKLIIPEAYEYDCLEEKTPSNTNYIGNIYKDLEKDEILKVLETSATNINSGKGSTITESAQYSQPIRYAQKSGKISTIVILELNEDYRFNGDSMKFRKQTLSGKTYYKFSNEQKEFSTSVKPVCIFVPNDRSYDTFYKTGADKLVEFMFYNAEVYKTTNIKGEETLAAIVFYNENIDTFPNYRSENIVVSGYETGTDSNGSFYKMTGYVNGVEKTYRLSNGAVYTTACVLDENFERTNEFRSVEIGDVVRIGTALQQGLYKNIEIIYDISESDGVEKATAVDKKSNIMNLDTLEDYADDIHYYARVGKMTGINGTTIENSTGCNLSIGGATSKVFVGDSYGSRPIILYDYNVTNEKNRIKTDVTMRNLYGDGTETLFVWQTKDMEIMQIYAVRYPQTQP